MPAPRWLARFNLHVTNRLLVCWRDICPAWEWFCMWDEKHIGSTASTTRLAKSSAAVPFTTLLTPVPRAVP